MATLTVTSKQDPTASSHLSLTFPPVPPHSTAYPSNLPAAIMVRMASPAPGPLPGGAGWKQLPSLWPVTLGSDCYRPSVPTLPRPLIRSATRLHTGLETTGLS